MTEVEPKTLYDEEMIRKKVAELGAKIDEDYPQTAPVLITILGGSVVFMADLLRAIKQPVRYEAVQVLYSDPEGDVVRINFPIEVDVTGQDLLVIKDVVATGVIENYLKTQLLGMGARRVRVVGLIDLPEERRSDLQVDYRLFSPRRPGIFVGYGLKRDGRFGNLRYLARLGSASGISTS